MLPSAMTRTSEPGHRRPKPMTLVLAGLAIIAVWAHAPLGKGAYVLSRDVDIASTQAQLTRWPTLQNSHFRVYYPVGQKTEAEWVLNTATRALPFEEHNLAEVPHHRLTVVMYATESAMNAAVGLPANANNIGYDYNGVMDILSPKAWLGQNRAAHAAFVSQGPVPHELGHALLNLKADANYPNWFNEGVAQYEDFRTTGYQWTTKSNSLTGPLYSMNQLNQNFYGLANQSRAYREGLALVSYLETVHGTAVFQQFLGELAHGMSFDAALSHTYHLSSQTALFSAWQAARR